MNFLSNSRYVLINLNNRYTHLFFPLFIIGIYFIATVFPYRIITDRTENANSQIIEFARLPPGTIVSGLKIMPRQQPSFFSGWINPVQNEIIFYPILKNTIWNVVSDTLIFDDYNGINRRIYLVNQIVKLDERIYFFGSDSFGRDVFSRLVLGTRVSFSIGVFAGLFSLIIGLGIGLISGYFGSWTDKICNWFISIIWSFPSILLAILLSFSFGKGYYQLVFAISLTLWVELARIVRGQVIALKESLYIQSARVLGFSSLRILMRHLLPNIVGPVIIITVSNISTAVLLESGLSFLGMGLPAPVPSWGSMLFEGYTFLAMEQGKWLAFFPAFALSILILNFYWLGGILRDKLDVKSEYAI